MLFVKSSLSTVDYFVRLCDVDKKNNSRNICDGIIHLSSEPQLTDENGMKIEFDLWPTAYQFKTGHKIRIQVSSGAHPRFFRNLGTNEPIATGTTMQKAYQTIFHDSKRPSSILLNTIQN